MQLHAPLSTKREASAASTVSFDRTRSATALPRTCSSEAWTSALSRSCSDIPASDPRRSTRSSPSRCVRISGNYYARPPTVSSREGGRSMVKPSIGPPQTGLPSSGSDIELADVVRRFAPEYTSRYASGMMPSQKREPFRISRPVAPGNWVGGCTTVTTAVGHSGVFTAAATERVRNVTEDRRKSGSKNGKPNFCHVTIFMPWPVCPRSYTACCGVSRSTCTGC